MKSDRFETEYAKLNEKQKEAVDTIEGPVMVIAGPGTGKTTILTLRIANILKLTDTPPSGILALTFTDAGAKNMRLKLREIIGDRALEIPIHTFHGFASSIINEFNDHFPELAKSKQITEVESEMILREILKQQKFKKLRPLGDPDFYLQKILKTVSDAKGEAWTPEMIESFALAEIVRIKEDPEMISTRGASKGNLKGEALKRIEKCERTIIFSQVYREYEAQKVTEQKIDFDDLIFEVAQALRTDQLLLQILQEKYLYILVDEHQDTNDAQNLIVRQIADFFENPNLFVVGDEKQAIYRFQGASVENFLSFQKIWVQMKIISLTENYRSHQNILDASFQMIENNYGANEHKNLRVKLTGQNKNKKLVEIGIAENTTSEDFFLIDQIQTTLKSDPESTVAVIVRKNSEVSRILNLLNSNEIEASAERGTNIFAHPVGILFFDLLKFLNDPSETAFLANTLISNLWQTDFGKQIELIKLIKSNDLENLTKQLPQIVTLQKALTQSGPLEYLAQIAEISGFNQLISQSPLSTEVWRTLFELAKDLTQSNKIEDPKKLIESLLAHQKSAEKKIIKMKTGSTEAKVMIMTSHSSKGLEFDYVFLPNATEESWLSKQKNSYFVLPKEKEGNDDLRDDRRLFYVALTRAKKHLVISYSQNDGLGKTLSPLRFIEELAENNLTKIEIKTNEAQKIPILIKKTDQLMKEKNNYAKMILLEKGLSVTALNHFLECPNKFFYRSILKLPEPPTASSEKGTAMHEALSNVWKNLTPSPSPINRRGGEEIETIIKTSVTNYFKHSLLAKPEREAVLEELLENAPKVARALTPHFNQDGQVSTEKSVENYFQHSYGGKPIEIRLHGKMDTIVEKEDKTLVFDYKTKEVMSEKEIKGETKNSDGNYFRQLIFYKILLLKNSHLAKPNIIPALVFVKPDSKGECPTTTLPIEPTDIERVNSEIKSLIETVWSNQLLSKTCSDPDCKYCGWKNL